VNSTESRWMRILRYDTHDLDGLHAAERNADLQWRGNYADGRHKEAGDGWEVAGIRYMDKIDSRLGSYWESGKLEEEKAREISSFQDCPVVRKMFAKMEETELTDQAFMAQADFEIHSKAYRVNFGKGSSSGREKLKELYKK
jgi:hypothetical protein